MTAILTNDDLDDTPLTQLRLATQLPTASLAASRLKVNSPTAQRISTNNERDRTLQILFEKDLNSEGPVVAAARRAQKRRAEQGNASTLPGSKRVCVRDEAQSSTVSSDDMIPDEVTEGRGRRHIHASTLPKKGDQDDAEAEDRARVLQKLQDLWSGDKSCGIPSQWHVKAFDSKSANMYLNLCQSVKARGLDLSCLWVYSPQYLETQCRLEGKFSASALKKAIERFERDGAQSLLQNTDRLLKAASIERPSDQQDTYTLCKRLLRTRRVVPGSQTRCGTDQELILESSDVAFPPLPGKDKRPGALPQKLFESFTAQADSNPAKDLDSATGADLPSVSRSANPNIASSGVSDSDPTQEVSASQWPASPEYQARPVPQAEEPSSRESSPLSSVPSSVSSVEDTSMLQKRLDRRNLPPDSSQIQPSQNSQQIESAATSPKQSLAQEEISNQQHSGTNTSLQQQISPESEAVNQLIQSTDSTFSHDPNTNTQIQTKTPISDPPKSISKQRSPDEMTRPIQVAQTPFPGKLERRPEAPVPLSTFVPSTYQENVNHQASTRVLDTESTREAQQTSSGTSTSVPKDSSHQSSGRTVQKPCDLLKSSSEELSATQYEEKMQGHRKYRRSILAPISKGNTKSRAAESSEKDEVLDTTTHQSEDPVMPLRVTLAQTSTSPSRLTEVPIKEIKNATLAPAHDAVSTQRPPPSPYEMFCNSYIDYTATAKQFETACRLLAKHVANGRVHSFLLDDFVFHYAQSYLPYLSECHESGDDPSPYLEYFNLMKAQTAHSKKVIVLSDLTSRPSTLVTKPDHLQASQITPKKQNAKERASASERQETEGLQRQIVESLANDNSGTPHLDASQKSSVEEWLNKTVHRRSPSPELGTQGIFRSLDHAVREVKEVEAQSCQKRSHNGKGYDDKATTKRLRVENSPAPMLSAAPSSQARSISQLHANLPVSSDHSTASPKAAAPLARPTPVRRSLPASFSSSSKRLDVPPSASLPTSALKPSSSSFAKPTVPGRRISDIKARISSSARTNAERSKSSVPRPASTVRRSLDPNWWKQDITPFKRFAAFYLKLPPQN